MDAFRLTLDEVYGRYCGEPFLLRPWEIARLTDWQLEFLYRRPAERADREARGLPSSAETDTPAQPTMPTDREEFVRWWGAVNGGGREEALERFAQEYQGHV